jgi:hypothetical protein
MSAHTPGPWSIWGPCHEGDEFKASNTKPGYEITSPSENASVARVEWDHGDDEAKVAATADAALIAAAPDLLAIIEALVSMRDESDFTHEGAYEAFHKGGAEEVWERARAAIAKARGGK